jgi:hypothetical protein
MTASRKKIFISYSQKNKNVAKQISDELKLNDLDVWIDVEQIAPGERISEKITEGMTASDYYVLLISEDSRTSKWVQSELSLAFNLSKTKKLTVVPLLLDTATIPLELQGMLYIDLRKSASEGIRRLVDFIKTQFSKVSDLEPYETMLKSESDIVKKRLACEKILRDLTLSELRYHLSNKLTRQHVEVIWFDLFNKRMADEVPVVADLSMSCVELIDRARREDTLANLLNIVCRNHPHLSAAAF